MIDIERATLADVVGGAGEPSMVFNYGGAATITPEGGQPITIPGHSTASGPGTGYVPQGPFRLAVGKTTFQQTFASQGQRISLVSGPGPNNPGIVGAPTIAPHK